MSSSNCLKSLEVLLLNLLKCSSFQIPLLPSNLLWAEYSNVLHFLFTIIHWFILLLTMTSSSSLLTDSSSSLRTILHNFLLVVLFLYVVADVWGRQRIIHSRAAGGGAVHSNANGWGRVHLIIRWERQTFTVQSDKLKLDSLNAIFDINE